jgi:O-succinylbenzoic acid--CoA ligase
LPVKYVAGKMMLIRAMVLGMNLEFVAPSSHPMKNTENDYDFVAMVPMQAQNSLKELEKVKKLIIGGAKINKTLENDLIKLKSTQVFETYGMTETITHIAAKRIGAEAFTVLPNVTISYDDRKCLVIDAPKINDIVIITNDLVVILNENQFVFLGRIDNIINSGGIKIMPEQVEQKLDGKIDRRFFIASKEDTKLGEKVVLVVEGEPFEINTTIFEVLDKYERPKEIVFVKKFNETANGKVIRRID